MVPVLFLVFNRPRHTKEAWERLRKARPERLYIHADGARPDRAGEGERVAEVRAIIEQVDWPCEVKRLYRDKNFGLRAGVSDALNWFFEAEPYGIVLEDDCLPDASFFPFCAELLQKYEGDERIMHICGTNFIDNLTQSSEYSYTFSQFSLVWGWATWRRAWKKMTLGLDGFEAYREGHEIRTFLPDVQAQAYMLDKFEKTHLQLNNSWAYAWQYSVLKSGGLTILPKVNLIENVGVGDEEATHTKTKTDMGQRKAYPLPFPLRHPPLEKNTDLELQLFYASQKPKKQLLLWFLLKKVGLR